MPHSKQLLTDMIHYFRPALFSFILNLFATLALSSLTVAHAQDGNVDSKIEGSWKGTLEIQQADFRLIFHVERGEEGELIGTMDSPDQGAEGIPISAVSVEEETVVFEVDAIDGRFEGEWTDEGALEGAWLQGGQSFPLELAPAEENGASEPERG
ncbi:MAG: hypothetical protein PPP56_06045 [Longimonas sp.]|uniref:hypothetical protein n=1 Tax=Longimonas sp. TaxID=2039626 RepID=UPI003360B840